jgi:hypothetical protein
MTARKISQRREYIGTQRKVQDIIQTYQFQQARIDLEVYLYYLIFIPGTIRFRIHHISI